jgi:ribosomal protein S26
MNRGCVAVGEIRCDNCQRLIEAGQRYLVVEEKEGEKSQFCVECSVAKGYASYVKEKGEEVLTFFPVSIDS